MAKRFRKQLEKGLKTLAIVIIVTSLGGFFFLRWQKTHTPVAEPVKHQTGYKADDRAKLERLIHEGAKND